jgi:Tol biopolymer transport system component
LPLQPGARLGPYEIVSALGAGGMGEVYRARDTRLDRTVAIKILPDWLAGDPQFRERFNREARSISSLDHPHICALYDVGDEAGTSYLVMQYLEGSTLQERLVRGPLPIGEALTIAVQIAGALDRAHRSGITHRDLKPGNIMLTKAGAKLLDFGLAKSSSPAVSGAGLSMMPTTPASLTAQGTILGTFQYMAPGQIEGQEADARTDIFAFGAVLHEMVTGRKAFEARSQASLIAAILERDPAITSTLEPSSPRALDAVVKRCLAKDPDERWQSAGDLTVALKWLLDGTLMTSSETGTASAAVRHRSSRRQLLWWAIAAALALTVIGLAALRLYEHRPVAAPESVRFSVPAPDKAIFETGVSTGVALSAGAISPDGRKLAFTAKDSSGKILLWIRPLDSLVAQPLSGTEGAGLPFWAPDSRWVGFFAQAKLRKVDIAGAPPQILCEAALGRGGTWNRDDVIVFAPNLAGGLNRVSASGGQPTPLTTVTGGQANHQFPHFLPDGRHFLYYAQGPSPENTGILLGALDSPESRQVLAADSAGVYARSGYLLFVRQGTLFAQPFDAGSAQLSGTPQRISDAVASELRAPAFSISDNGVLSYRTGLVAQDLQLTWVDRSGKIIELVGVPGGYHGVDLSPDGTRIAVHRHEGAGGDILILEPRKTITRLTFDAAQDSSSPIWSPDGGEIAFGAARNGKWGLYRKATNGSGAEHKIVESDATQIPASWSPDGKYLVYWIYDPKTSTDHWLLPLAGGKPAPLLNSSFVESHAQISPDGRWIAFSLDQTGRNEIYVRPFPSGDGQWQISTDGGVFPRWRGDSREIFYLTARTGGKLMAVPVNTMGSTLEAGAPSALFDSGYVEFTHPGAFYNYHVYAVSRDGKRFLIPRPTNPIQGDGGTAITVVLNWTAILKK